MIFSNKTSFPPLSLHSCVLVMLVMLSILRKLSSRNNNINGVNKWSCDNKEGGGRISQLRYNVLLPLNSVNTLQHSPGRGWIFIFSDKINK